jgi:hypothetical protein
LWNLDEKSFQGVDWIKMAQNGDEDQAVVEKYRSFG